MKTNRINLDLISLGTRISVFVLLTVNASAAEIAPTREEMTAAMRAKLVAPAEALLQEHCGEDCPSFRIDPIFKKSTPSSTIDDLGFSQAPSPDTAPELQSVSVSVLVQDRVSTKARESLRKIAANRLTNEAGVPVSVRLVALDAFAPAMEKREHPQPLALASSEKAALIKASIWPLCLLLLAGALLLGLSRVLRHRKEILAAANSEAEKELASEVPVTPNSEDKAVLDLLAQRPDDFRWLIENAALRADHTTLGKVLSAIPAHELSSKAQFSREALNALASLPLNSANRKPLLSADLDWFVQALDSAHWNRLEEQSDQLSRVRRLPVARAKRLFASLESTEAQAALVSMLPEELWPTLLANMKSEQRIKLGLNLADYSNAVPEVRHALETKVVLALRQLEDSAADRSRDALENLSLYLPEKEGQRLWQELSARTLRENQNHGAPLSLDSMLQSLDTESLAEICARLDFRTLSLVISQVSEESRARVLRSLPTALRTRLETTQSPGGDADRMKSRAELLHAYRRLKAETVTQ